jgi:hypothetical protein
MLGYLRDGQRETEKYVGVSRSQAVAALDGAQRLSGEVRCAPLSFSFFLMLFASIFNWRNRQAGSAYRNLFRALDLAQHIGSVELLECARDTLKSLILDQLSDSFGARLKVHRRNCNLVQRIKHREKARRRSAIFPT